MSRTLARRVAKIEAAQRPPAPRPPCVVRTLPGEAPSVAMARLRASVGIPAAPGLLCLPARLDPAHRTEWEAAFKAQQQALVADADIELSALRRAAQAVGSNEINPIAAAYARHNARSKSNPWRIDR